MTCDCLACEREAHKLMLASNPWSLSPRELDVISHLFECDSNKQIARVLGLAEPTIKAHLMIAFQKMQVVSRLQAAVVYERWKCNQNPETIHARDGSEALKTSLNSSQNFQGA